MYTKQSPKDISVPISIKRNTLIVKAPIDTGAFVSVSNDGRCILRNNNYQIIFQEKLKSLGVEKIQCFIPEKKDGFEFDFSSGWPPTVKHPLGIPLRLKIFENYIFDLWKEEALIYMNEKKLSETGLEDLKEIESVIKDSSIEYILLDFFSIGFLYFSAFINIKHCHDPRIISSVYECFEFAAYGKERNASSPAAVNSWIHSVCKFFNQTFAPTDKSRLLDRERVEDAESLNIEWFQATYICTPEQASVFREFTAHGSLFKSIHSRDAILYYNNWFSVCARDDGKISVYNEIILQSLDAIALLSLNIEQFYRKLMFKHATHVLSGEAHLASIKIDVEALRSYRILGEALLYRMSPDNISQRQEFRRIKELFFENNTIYSRLDKVRELVKVVAASETDRVRDNSSQEERRTTWAMFVLAFFSIIGVNVAILAIFIDFNTLIPRSEIRMEINEYSVLTIIISFSFIQLLCALLLARGISKRS